MSQIFYDRLIALEKFGKEVKKRTSSKEEEIELWELVDDILSHKVMDMILEKLPLKDHSEFIEKFLEAPFDEALFDYLQDKIEDNIQELIKQEVGSLAYQLLDEIKEQKTSKTK